MQAFLPMANGLLVRQRIVGASADGWLMFWQTPGAGFSSFEHTFLDFSPQSINSIEFSPNGTSVAVANSQGEIRIVSPLDGSVIAIIDADSNPISSARFSPDGKFLVSCTFKGKVRVYRTKDWSLLGELKGAHNWAWGATFSPNSREILTDGVARIFSLFDTFEISSK